MKKLSAVLTIVVSLLIVGLINTAIAPYTPTEYDVYPDEDGVARHDDYTVKSGGFHLAEELTHTNSWGDTERLLTDNVFLVMRAEITPYNRTMLASIELVTADGHTYAALSPYPFPYYSVGYVGVTTSAHILFELPPDKVEGSFVTIHGYRGDGIQPLWPRLRFDVTDVDVVDSLEVPANAEEPRR